MMESTERILGVGAHEHFQLKLDQHSSIDNAPSEDLRTADSPSTMPRSRQCGQLPFRIAWILASLMASLRS